MEIRNFLIGFAFSFLCLSNHALAFDSVYIKGSSNVDQFGAGNYSIPLELPPGVAGLQPQLALTYSSVGQNSYLGMGWNLTGLHAISRCPATAARDGYIQGVSLNANDRFCLDGERLYSVAFNEYRTEKESFARIFSYGTSGTGPSYFIAYMKNGQKISFGNTADSKLMAQTNTNILVWAADSVSDINQNYYSIKYINDSVSGQYYPSEIDYTGNSGQSILPMNSIKFFYETRPDVISAYRSTINVTSTKRLSHIRTYAQGNQIIDYQLTYKLSSQTGRSLLTQLVAASADGTKQLLPTNFDWNGPGFTYATVPGVPGQILNSGVSLPATYFSGGSPSSSEGWRTGDFDGDGVADILEIADAATSARVCYSEFGGTGLGCYSYSLPSALPSGDIMTGDFNGDGLADFIEMNPGSSAGVVCYSQGILLGFSCVGVSVSAAGAYGGSITGGVQQQGQPTQTNQFIPVDLNGDGITDILEIPPSGGQPTYCQFGSASGFVSCSLVNFPDFSIYNVTVGDFDGDGIQDVAYFVNSGSISSGTWISASGTLRICYSSQAGPGASCEDKLTSITVNYGCGTGMNCQFAFFSGDFNGDGVADLAQITTSGINIVFGVGRGVPLQLTSHSFVNWGARGDAFIVGDFNGDGKADIITKDRFNGTQICYSQGTGDFDCTAGPVVGDDRILFGNFVGGTNIDIVGGDSSGATIQIYKSPTITPDLMTSVQNGLGLTTTFNYTLLGSGIHNRSTGAIYPIQDIQSPMWVTSSKAQNDGIGGQNEINYRYSGAKIDLSGRGFLGFANVTENDISKKIKISTDYNQIYPLTAQVAAVHQAAWSEALADYQTVSSSLFKYIYNITNQTNPFVGAPTPVYLVQKQVSTFDLNSGKLVTNMTDNFQYDEFSNIISQTSSTNDGYSVQKSFVVQNFSGDPTSNPANWFLGQVNRIVQKNVKPNSYNIIKTRSYSYDSLHRLTQEKVEPDNLTTYLVTDISYDAFGNVTSKSVSGSGLSARTEQTVFDSNGQFPITKKDSYNHATNFTFNPGFGLPVSITDPNSLTTTFAYDALGRKQAEVAPDGTKSTLIYKICDAILCAPGQSYFVQSKKTGISNRVVYLDVLDRPVVTQEGGANDKWVYQYKYYSNAGYVQKVSRKTNGRPQYYTQFTYDSLGRVLVETDPDGSQKKFTYNGLVTTAQNNKGQIKTETKNSIGQLVKSTDDSGKTVSFLYDSAGNLIRSTDSQGNISSFSYDILGHKTGKVDGDSGAWSFTTNAAGEITASTDARGNTITTTYDDLGRILTQVTTEGTSTWTYDTTTHGVGKIASISRDNGYSKSFTYDSLSRPTNVQITMDTAYNIATSYDAYSRVNQVTYPTGFAVKYKYDSFGHAIEVDNASSGALLWKVTDVNADNNPLNEVFGNNVTAVKAYYADTGLLQSAVATPSSGPAIQNLSLTYDHLGNLTSRSELTDPSTSATIYETYGYDNLNRLVSVAGPASKTFTYDELGNIVTKSDVGTYAYGLGTSGSPLHAVLSTSGATSWAFTYDATGNMLTGNGRTMTWTSFNKPASIANSGNTINFYYDANLERYKEVATTCKDYHGTTSSTCVKYVINPAPGTGVHFEKEINGSITTYRHFIYGGPNNVIGVYSTMSDGGSSTNYFHTDHLGSVNVVSDASGNVVERLSYDAFGKRRNADGTDDSTNSLRSGSSHQGYTFQEHLDDGGLGLVHMNGRVYDPQLGRFMGVDPIVQSATNLQSWNRFAYVMNNPLKFTDPSGYCSWDDWSGCDTDIVNSVKNPGQAASNLAGYANDAVNAIITPKNAGYFIGVSFPVQSAILLNTTDVFQKEFGFNKNDKNNLNLYYEVLAITGTASVGGALGVSTLAGSMLLGASAGAGYSIYDRGYIDPNYVITGAALGGSIYLVGVYGWEAVAGGGGSVLLSAAGSGYASWVYGNQSWESFTSGVDKYFSNNLDGISRDFFLGAFGATAGKDILKEYLPGSWQDTSTLLMYGGLTKTFLPSALGKNPERSIILGVTSPLILPTVLGAF